MVYRGNLESARGGFSAQICEEILREHLPTVIGYNTVFMHDNARVHTAHLIRDFLQEEGYEVMEWPPYSPDLNPIENLWHLLKEKINANHPDLLRRNDARVPDDITTAALEAWEQLEEEILNHLASTMKKRCKAVKDVKGWYTKY